MRSKLNQENSENAGGPQFCEAIECVKQTVLDGLHHGFFRFTISDEIAKGNHKILIEAGKSYQFTIPMDELPN